jgi:F-type H+-transporting ATPase subunit alpha
MEVLKQKQYSPYPLEIQAAILFLAVNGYLMDVEIEDVASFVRNYIDYLQVHNNALLENISKTGNISAEEEDELRSAIDTFKKVMNDKK